MGAKGEGKLGGEERIDLSCLEDGRLSEIFEIRRHDQQFLEALNRELNRRESDEALELQFEVVKARRAFARETAPANNEHRPRQSEPVRDWLRSFLSVRDIQKPNSRPLYRYRMTDSEFERVKEILRVLASQGRLATPDDRAGAMFVAYCAEWFRRESVSTFLKWNDPEPNLFPAVPDSAKRDLTDRGLRYWRRELRRSDSGREFLLTVALEGGFPVRILTSGARAWLRDYLRSIMRRAITSKVDTLQEILEIAEEERGRMRKSYQHADFVALCSEVVQRLLDLRRSVEAEAAGSVRNSALLDVRRPGWREDLPIYVPAEDEALVTELLTGLLDEKMTGLSTEGVEARRYLVKSDGQWIPAIQLLADGEIPPSKLANLPTQGRVRAVPTGELSNHLSGELALLEAPMGEQRRWRVLPYTRTAKLLKNFPFTSAVTVTLTSPGSIPYPWTWPHGETLRSDLLVFRDDEGSTPDKPLLRLLRTGSVSSPHKTLHVLFPKDWTIESTSQGAVAGIEDLPHLRGRLARLVGTAYFHSGESDSLRFRVEPDTEGREYELEFRSSSATGFDLADDRCELAISPIDPLIRDGSKQPRPPRLGELFYRRPGAKWAEALGRVEAAGVVEFSLRDPDAGVQVEKRLVALFPIGARVSGTMKDARSGQIQLEGLPGWTASVANTSCVAEQTDATTVSFRFPGRPLYRLPMIIRPPVGQPCEIIVPLVGRDGVIALADGTIVEPGTQVDLGTLRGAIAISPWRAVLHVAAKGARSGGLSAAVDGELPLGILRSAIDEILASLPLQDDLAEFVFVGDTRLPIFISRYRSKQLVHEGGMIRWSETTGLLPVARMVLDPRHEHALEQESSGLWRFPERCKGLCLVYLRQGVDVVSRPVPVQRPGSPGSHVGGLVSALTIADHQTRQDEIAHALHGIGQEASGFSWLLEAATHLNGLPASAFDALKLLPSCPEAMIGLLFNARDAGERGIIWSLQNELPFLWLQLPLSAWRAALETDYTAVFAVLQPIFGVEKAATQALERLATLRSELTTLEPALASTFNLVGMGGETGGIPSLKDLTAGYIASQVHRGNEGRNDLAAQLAKTGLKLPPEIMTKSHQDFTGLFAPALLAASAREKLTIEHDLALLARRTLREDPFYVSGAYVHLLKFYGSK